MRPGRMACFPIGEVALVDVHTAEVEARRRARVQPAVHADEGLETLPRRGPGGDRDEIEVADAGHVVAGCQGAGDEEVTDPAELGPPFGQQRDSGRYIGHEASLGRAAPAARSVGILGLMSGLPSGTVTFVFSDIEGSTTLLKALGDGYGEVLDTHRRLMRTCFDDRGGVEIDTQGDAFFFAFPRARDAVAAAVEAQRLHASQDWPDGHAVRVRMGLHTGEPAVGSEGYLGIDVVRAARLCTVGRGGQVLLSETTRALVGGTLPEGVSVHTLGERHLKDIDEPERVFELDIEGAPTPEEAPHTAPTPQSSPAPERSGGRTHAALPWAEGAAASRLRRSAGRADPGTRTPYRRGAPRPDVLRGRHPRRPGEDAPRDDHREARLRDGLALGALAAVLLGLTGR